MKIQLKLSSLEFALDTAEFLYKLHPLVLKQALELKRSFGDILGIIDLKNLSFEQREQLLSLKSLEGELTDDDTKSVEGELTDNDSKSVEKKLKEYYQFKKRYKKLETVEYIDFGVCLEIEDVQYGRMIAELFENITGGFLYEILNLKREEDEQACLIGRYTEVGDKLTKEEDKILKENGYE